MGEPKSIFATFGWTETPVISAILRYGLKEGDKIFLILPEWRDERSDAAIRDLKSFISSTKGVDVQEIRVNLEDFASSVSRIRRAIEDERGRKCIVNLSGGMRALVLSTYIAASVANHPNLSLELETENRRMRIEVPKLSVRDLSNTKLSRRMIQTMRKLLSGPKRSPDLRRELGISSSSFHRIQEELEKRGYIERRKVGKAYLISLTPRGRLILEFMGG